MRKNGVRNGYRYENGGRVGKMGGGMSTARKDMADGFYKDDMGMAGGSMYKKGGSVKAQTVPESATASAVKPAQK